jgi:hypothetical protein
MVQGLADLLLGTPNESYVTFEKAVVTDVNDDGSVNIDTVGDDIGLMTGIPCLASYRQRKEDDVVLTAVLQSSLVVLGKIGPSDDDSDDDPITIRWGDAAPTGSNWVKSASGDIFVQDDVLYVQRYLPDTPPPAPRTQKGGSKTIAPKNMGAYRQGRREASEDSPIQGAWTSYPHPWTGLWVYGSDIKDACTGNSIDHMTVKMTRAKGQGGVYGGAQVRLYLYGNGTMPGGTPSLTNFWSPGKLTPGGSKTFTLPSSWVTKLASGDARGIGCKAGVGSDYLTYNGGGTVKVYFN